jgi:hypothetical protein
MNQLNRRKPPSRPAPKTPTTNEPHGGYADQTQLPD